MNKIFIIHLNKNDHMENVLDCNVPKISYNHLKFLERSI